MALNKSLVTVLMPVFNAEDFLRESINSILNQTYDYFELLIINDSSNNDSSNNKIYNINFINFDIINKNVVLDKNNNIDNIIFNNDSLFFIQDLNCIYLIFEKNSNDEIFINKSKIINIKTKNIKIKNIKTKNINNKIKSINKTKKIINIK